MLQLIVEVHVLGVGVVAPEKYSEGNCKLAKQASQNLEQDRSKRGGRGDTVNAFACLPKQLGSESNPMLLKVARCQRCHTSPRDGSSFCSAGYPRKPKSLRDSCSLQTSDLSKKSGFRIRVKASSQRARRSCPRTLTRACHAGGAKLPLNPSEPFPAKPENDEGLQLGRPSLSAMCG